MKMLPLVNGGQTLVDDEDHEPLSRFKWYKTVHNGHAYASRTPQINGKGFTVMLHRCLFQMPNGFIIDHKDRDGLNNQKSNLRPIPRKSNGNNANSGLQRNNTTGVKGVSFNKLEGRWMARIRVKRKMIHLGYFDDKFSAARAYDQAALIHFGEFALTNEMIGLMPIC